MTGILVDTQKMVRQLEEAGVSPLQARAHIAVLVEVIVAMETAIIERCATKQDLAQGFSDLKAAIQSLDTKFDVRFADVDVRFANVDTRFAEVDARMAKQETRLTRWVVSVGILQTALIAALLLKLVP
jgi:chromosome segregation ATPase